MADSARQRRQLRRGGARRRQRRLRLRAAGGPAGPVGGARREGPSSAAPVCTSAASRPRRCSTPPRSPTPRASPSSSASTPTFEGIDMGGVNKYKDGVVARLFKGLTGLVEEPRHHRRRGRGPAHGRPHGSQVDGRALEGGSVVLATGSYARSLPGLEVDGHRVLTSEHALTLDHVPSSVVVLGGGVIGCEFASVWRSFGAEVTIVEALPRLVAAEDEAVSQAAAARLRQAGHQGLTDTSFESVERPRRAFRLAATGGDPLEAELLLVAVGRGPSTTASASRSRASDRPRVRRDRRAAPHQRRGRVRRRRHRARTAAGASRLRAGHLRRRADRRPRPEADRRGRHPAGHLQRSRGGVGRPHRGGRPRDVRRRRRADADLRPRRQRQEPDPAGTQGFVKLVRASDGPVVGVHVVGARAGELIGEAQLIYGWEAHPEDVAPFVHAHPTQHEALGEAHLALAGKPLHAHS